MHAHAWAAAGVGAAGAAFLLFVAVAETCGFGRRPAAWNADCLPEPRGRRRPLALGSDLAFILAGLAALGLAEARGAGSLLPLGALMVWLRPGSGRLDRLSVQACSGYVVTHEAVALGAPMPVFWGIHLAATASLLLALRRPDAPARLLLPATAVALLATAGLREPLWLLAAAVSCVAGVLLSRSAEREPLCPAHRDHMHLAGDVLTAAAALLAFLPLLR